jgi:hypothetical protein
VLSLSLTTTGSAQIDTNFYARRDLSHNTFTIATLPLMLATAFSGLSMSRLNDKREQTLQPQVLRYQRVSKVFASNTDREQSPWPGYADHGHCFGPCGENLEDS